jgi:hypothetical protein
MVVLAAVTALCSAQAPTPNPRLSDDEVAIYREYLKTVAKTTIHLGNRTMPVAGSKNPQCLTSAGIAFPATPNINPLDADVVKGLKIELVDSDAQRQLVVAAKTPKAASALALYTLSPIAFDKDRRRAAMQYAVFCGGSCSTSAILIFEKVKDQWRWTGRFCSGKIA